MTKNPFTEAGETERVFLKRLAKKLSCNHILMPSKCKYDALLEKNRKIYVIDVMRMITFATVLYAKI